MPFSTVNPSLPVDSKAGGVQSGQVAVFCFDEIIVVSLDRRNSSFRTKTSRPA